MLIIGAGGLAKDLLNVITEFRDEVPFAFYDDISESSTLDLLRYHRIIRSQVEAAAYFRASDHRFILGIGKPHLRKTMFDIFEGLGGQLTSLISPRAVVGSFNLLLEEGCTILPLSVVSNASRIGRGCLVHHRAVVSHDCDVGEFCELSPGATLLGHVTIGDLTHIGANATIIPGIRIGSGCMIGAGSVVNHDVPDGKIVAGNPARAISKINKDA
jgi:sugar O-acyltransferase (sialic acid O-acetyltransferase NeuD family)